MRNRGRGYGVLLAALTVTAVLAAPRPSAAHPMGNFSISHYAALRIERDGVRLRYLLDMAEIPTFQEIQASGIVAEANHPSLPAYLARAVETWKEGLSLEVDGRRLSLHAVSSEVIFPPGAGGLPTLKLGVVYRAPLTAAAGAAVSELRYRDANLPDRAGWKEIVAVGGSGVTFVESSVPEQDRSRELADYPTDLLASPPQDLEARVVFTRDTVSPPVARTEPRVPLPSERSPTVADRRSAAPRAGATTELGRSISSPPATKAPAASGEAPIRLQANQLGTPRDAFTELIATRQLGLGLILFAMVIAASLGAFHALEPGHGKTVVAAYLVGSRGTAWHALILGLIVTASHTAGVYLLGAVTLYASRYVVPERLYPWLGVVSGLTIAALGFVLFLRRYADASHPHGHGHDHHHHEHGDAHHHHSPGPDGPVSLRALLALGITGGIVPCPAALVVLLSAVALRRVGFGLLLIVAFSVGLAAVLVGIGLLMVYARRFMSRFQGEGPLITRWLPLTSAAVIALSGVAITVQALVTSGMLHLRL